MMMLKILFLHSSLKKKINFQNILRRNSRELFVKSSSTSDIARRRLQRSFPPADNSSSNNDRTNINAHVSSMGNVMSAELLEQRLSQITSTSVNQSHISLNSPLTLPNVRKYVQTRLRKHSSPIIDLSLASQANKREMFQVQVSTVWFIGLLLAKSVIMFSQKGLSKRMAT